MPYIYKTVSLHDFREAFRVMGRGGQFTYGGLAALYESLTDLAEDLGEPLLLDVVALCCDYVEYQDLSEYNAAHESDYESWEDVDDLECLAEEHGAIIRNR